jgi:hypothetical protein
MRNIANKFDISGMLSSFDAHSWERINQPLYDTVDYPELGGHLAMFCEPVGVALKTMGDTNMFLCSQLPTGQAFIIGGITLELLQDSPNKRDERRFYQHGWFTFVIGAKVYNNGLNLEVKKGTEIPSITLTVSVREGLVSTAIERGDDFVPYKLEPNNLLLVANQNFRLQISELPKLSRPARIRATLHGELLRTQ